MRGASQALESVVTPDFQLLLKESRKTLAELHSQAQVLRESSRLSEHSRVALDGLDACRQVVAMLAFDGYVGELLFLPLGIDASTKDRLLEIAGASHLMCLQDEVPRSIAQLPDSTELQATRWVLATSGTTGTPKLIRHHLGSLTSSGRGNGERNAGLTWGLFYDAARFAGLQVLLHAMMTGAQLAAGEDSSFESQISSSLSNQINALSATPSMWRKLLIDGRIVSLKMQQVTLGGEIADQRLLDSLARHFPAARITHVYASTEAGSGFAVSDRMAGFPASWLNDRRRQVGLRVGVDDHLMIKPANSAEGDYVKSIRDDDGYLDTGDIVKLDDAAQRVFFLGRATGAINVGGNKVIPEKVEEVLLRVPGVQEAHVYARKSSILGQIVAADIVLATGWVGNEVKRQVKEAGDVHLEPWQRPSMLKIVDSLENTPAGKKVRRS